MTHLYTLLVGGTVIPDRDLADVSAIAWADDTVVALGNDVEVRAISRGDSYLVDLRGAVVVPLGDDDHVTWPAEAKLEVGSRADLAVLSGDPRVRRVRTLALVRGGRVVEGKLPGASPGVDHH